MRITFVTLFPEFYENFVKTSIVGRAVERGLVEIDFVQIRDFAKDKYKHVDDTPFGGGAGMVMKCQPVLDALDSVRMENSHIILTAAYGQPYTQKRALELAKMDHLILLCGHYEGVDARIHDHVDELISIGDYVLTGGELASQVIADSVIRLLKGAIKEESWQDESYQNGLLEYPQYTQPYDYNGEKVPEVLLSGHHENIRKWRKKESLRLTLQRRPDLLNEQELDKEARKMLKELEEEGAPRMDEV